MKRTFDPNTVCACGKVHKTMVEHRLVKSGAINDLPEYLKLYNVKKAFIVADTNTYPIAGEKVCKVLEANGIATSKYIFTDKRVIPNEKTVGALFMGFDNSCDVVIGVGSGVINDTSKILANVAKVPYVIVATAAYMDGYASGNSSMEISGVKVTVNSKSPEIIVGDIDVLNGAPVFMAKAGLGDMLAKYVSICEWRLSNLINGEYYCEEVAQFTRDTLKACVDNAQGLLAKDEKAMEALFNGLIDCGAAMDYAGCSRPGGGVEHYFSHLWDMRGIEFGTPTSSHGMQVAIGTVYSIKALNEVKNIIPNKQKALEYAANFDFEAWSEKLREFVGKGAEAMIALEAKERKYDLEKHQKRLEVILDKWDDVIRIIDEEIPSVEEFEKILDSIEAPKTIEGIGMDKSILPMTFMATKDIRDKYIIPRLLWDLGVLEEVCDKIF